MIQGTKGFTLIELLVVVLIIGILGAVALPQYQKAVLKNKLARLKPLVTTLARAAEQYYMEHGQYPTRFSNLEITIPTPLRSERESSTKESYFYSWGTCRIEGAVGTKRQNFVSCHYGEGNGQITYIVYLPLTNSFPVGPSCGGSGAIVWAVCQQETGISVPFYTRQRDNYKLFSYSKKSEPHCYE